ncbi:MAG: hypothetical protein NVSMB58_34950 [Terriglobales bacterium]
MEKVEKHSGSSAAEKSFDLVEIEQLLFDAVTPELFCAKLSKLFRVRGTEVALMRLNRGQLTFLFPSELRTAGSVPVSNSSAVAARTTVTKKTEIFNNFVKIKHTRIFETVTLGTPETVDISEKASIQKLMSAPVLDGSIAIGVIQVCRRVSMLVRSDRTSAQTISKTWSLLPKLPRKCRSSRMARQDNKVY